MVLFLLFALFLSYWKSMAKISRKLDKKTPSKLPPFNLPEPNDDMAAFGWSMDRLRYPAESSTKNDIWPGRSVFEIAEARQLVDQYGFNIDFVNPKFIQVMLDNSVAVRAMAEKCATAKYSEESRAALRKTIMQEFKDVIVPAMLERFKKVSGLVADFYAARIAHLMTYGPEDN
jgi:hypothetical protein